jgi:hypothetical protein
MQVRSQRTLAEACFEKVLKCCHTVGPAKYKHYGNMVFFFLLMLARFYSRYTINVGQGVKYEHR